MVSPGSLPTALCIGDWGLGMMLENEKSLLRLNLGFREQSMSWTLPTLLAGVLIVVLFSPLSRRPMSMIKQTVDTIRLKSLRPEGTISEDDFVFGIEELNQVLQAGEVLFKLLAISADPFQRGRMKSAEGKYDEIMSGFVAGQVVESNNAQFPQGALIAGYRPYRTFQILKSSEMSAFWDLTAFISPEEISLGVGVLGMVSFD